ncbi:hypothetical protein HaLaN_32585, partial [Haematococcus lacustris]
MTVTNAVWRPEGPQVVAVDTTSVPAWPTLGFSEGGARLLGSAGPTSQLYTVTLPKTLPDRLLRPGPSGALLAPTTAAMIWGPGFFCTVDLGGPAAPLQALNASALLNTDYEATFPAPLPLDDTCFRMALAKQRVGNSTRLAITVAAIAATPACLAAQLALQRPLYLRLVLSPRAAAALAAAPLFAPQ